MFLEDALTYLELGWCVYPAHSVNRSGQCTCGRSDCPSPGKHPVGRWAAYQHRLPTRSEVETWFSRMECNVGTVTGSLSGIVVVDVDGVKGLSNLKSLTLPPTLVARTGGGGRHYFFSCDEPVQSRVGAVEGVDVRGDGGFVVLPPSIHKSGSTYEWLRPRPLAAYDPSIFPNTPKLQYRSLRDTWYDELLDGVAHGYRSVSAARLAGRYASMGLSLEEISLLMVGWNARNDPPLETVDLLRTVKSVYSKHQSNNGSSVSTLTDIANLLGVMIHGNDE